MHSDPLTAVHIIALLDRQVESLLDQGFDTFLCGMADGFDLMAGMAVVRAMSRHDNIRLVAVIPYRNHIYSIDPDGQTDYRTILDAAKQSIYIADSYLGPQLYLRRNDYIVDHSDLIVCYFDGQKGGTAYTIARARKAHRRIINLYVEPDTLPL